jgi:acyl carrier protein
MLKKDIEKTIFKVINDNLFSGKSWGEMTVDSDIASLGINSIDFIKILVALETEFELEFDEEDLNMKRFPTIQSIVTYIENKKSHLKI